MCLHPQVLYLRLLLVPLPVMPSFARHGALTPGIWAAAAPGAVAFREASMASAELAVAAHVAIASLIPEKKTLHALETMTHLPAQQPKHRQF